ncbi:hypothetical protein ACEQ8H_007412 [Pleosporales sp. CAS-2024a]
MVEPFRPSTSAEELPTYYNDLSDDTISHCFRNFDLSHNFDALDAQTRNPRTSNFCLDFGEYDAYCAFDLDATSYAKLLASPRPPQLHTRWINMWIPYNQKDVLKVLAEHFDFTPRLLGMMRSDPTPPRNQSLKKKKSSSSSTSTLRSRFSGPSPREKEGGGGVSEEEEEEESIGMTELMHSTQLEIVQDLNHYQLVKDVWHWSTVDWGRRLPVPVVCLGYNSLHNIRTKPREDAHNDELDRTQDLPHGKRVWNWLLLCEDKTVISVSEDPFPFTNASNLSAADLKLLYTTRRNLVNVFRQLTKAPTPLHDAALIQLPIRQRVGHSDEETAHRTSDAPGLLFYYLFEDWGTTFNLISKREHGYAAELDRLRQEMLVKASLTHIDRLHHIGCQLSLLKRCYQSYILIIERVLKKQEATLASLKNSRVLGGAESFTSIPTIPASYTSPCCTTASAPPSGGGGGDGGAILIPEADSLLGVSLSSAAKVRFERLKDRISLYALSEIEESLSQKDSLVMMNFNLIAIKESLSVERLTWVTLLLAKITILFTPVTLMTGYFSIQFKDVEFGVGAYWWAFGGVFGGSLLLLVLFSAVSGTLREGIVTRTWGRKVFDGSRRWMKGRRDRDKGKDV